MSENASDATTPPRFLARRASHVRWVTLAVLFAFSWTSWFNRVSLSVAYDEQLRNELGISERTIGCVYSALAFAYMICMAPGGWLTDRLGPRLTLTVVGLGSALFVALTGIVGLATLPMTVTIAALFVIRAALGAFMAPTYPSSSLAIARWIPTRQRAAANGSIMAAAILGVAACPHAFGGLLDLFDWPTAFMIAGIVTALLALLWLWYARDLPSQHAKVNLREMHLIHSGESNDVVHDGGSATEPTDAVSMLGPASGDSGEIAWRALLTNRSLTMLTLSYAAVGYFQCLFFFWMHYYFDEVLRLGKYDSRTYTTFLYLVMAVGMFLGGWLADRLARVLGRHRGRALVVVTGMLGGALLLGIGLFANHPGWIVLCFALALAAVGSVEGPMWATALELGRGRGATAAGIFNTGGNAGAALAPMVTPIVSMACGWKWGIWLGGVVCLGGVTLWLWIHPAKERG